ncbi:MAG: hypothetical protein JW829_03580 [Pirellulales bacterium]|nr:hypothetical protein [Pirellulales bacterium]
MPTQVTTNPLPTVVEAFHKKNTCLERESPLLSASHSSSKHPEPAATKSSRVQEQKERVESFKTPFSSRVDIFAPPQRIQQAVRKNEDTNETVTLQGFVQVDQLQVVLNIDGTIAPMKAGEKKYGIHVISIEPPKVVLQRGNNRWTATLDN